MPRKFASVPFWDKGYYIANSEDLDADGVRSWLLQSLSVNNMLNETKDMRERILFEKIPSSQKWLPVIVNAMRDGKVIEMTYQSFWRDEPNTYTAKPYCLKLFKQRWLYQTRKVDTKIFFKRFRRSCHCGWIVLLQNLKYICNLQLLKYKSQCLSGTIC